MQSKRKTAGLRGKFLSTASDGKLYVSAMFDCYDLTVLGLTIDTNMKATLCEQTLDNAIKAYPAIRGAIIHSNRGTH